MKTRDWAALLVGIAGAAATLAAIPATNYRLAVIIVAALLIVIALAIAILPRRSTQPSFEILTPHSNHVLNDGGRVVVSGTAPELDSDTIWVFEEALINGRRAWFFGGEAQIACNKWSFDYKPTMRPTDGTRRTLSIVRANRNCDRQLRSVRSDSQGHSIVYDPEPGGCEILGQISMFLAAPP